MKAKIKKQNNDGIVRIETSGDIRDVWINEDFMHPNDESISLGFRGKDSSGIVEFSTKEFEDIYKTIRKRLHLIKGFKIIK